MDIAKLLGQNVNQAFTEAAQSYQKDREKGFEDYPGFDPAYYYSEAYANGYAAAYHATMDAREERWMDERDFPREVAADRRRGL